MTSKEAKQHAKKAAAIIATETVKTRNRHDQIDAIVQSLDTCRKLDEETFDNSQECALWFKSIEGKEFGINCALLELSGMINLIQTNTHEQQDDNALRRFACAHRPDSFYLRHGWTLYGFECIDAKSGIVPTIMVSLETNDISIERSTMTVDDFLQFYSNEHDLPKNETVMNLIFLIFREMKRKKCKNGIIKRFILRGMAGE